jgi:hypothetical protein
MNPTWHSFSLDQSFIRTVNKKTKIKIAIVETIKKLYLLPTMTMTVQKMSKSSTCFILTFVLIGFVVITFVSLHSPPLCLKFDCKSDRVRILGKLIRYPSKIGIRNFLDDRQVEEAFRALNHDQVVLNSIRYEQGLFSAKSLNKTSSLFSEFVIVCPGYFVQCDSNDNFNSTKSVQLPT